MATPGRVPAPELNLRPQLNPAPVVDVAMVRPVNRDGAGSNLMRIADALGSLGGSVARFGAATARQQGAAKSATDANFVKINQFRPPDEIVMQPNYDPTSEPQRVLVGQATANQIGPQMRQWVMEEWDPTQEPDLTKFLTSRLGQLQATMDPAAQAGFGSTIDSSVRDTVKWWTDMQNDEKNTAMKQNTFSHFISLNTLYKDLPVEERVAKMKEMGLDQYRMLKFTDNKGANNLLMDAVDYFAKTGDKDMVRALSELRRGKDGEVPSLNDIPDYRDRVDKAIATADAEWVKLNQSAVGDFEKSVDEVTTSGDLNKLTELFNGPVGSKLFPNPAERGEKLRAAEKKLNESILKNTVEAEKTAALETHRGNAVRNFWTGNGGQNYEDVVVTTKDGKKTTYKGQDEAQYALDQDIKKRYEEAAGDPEKVAAVDRAVARAAAQSSLNITEWENLFSGALTTATTNSLLEGKIPPNLKRGFELWQNTRDNPRVRRANMGEKVDQTDTFFSLVDTFKTAGYGEAEAFVAANEAQPRLGQAIGRVSEELFGQNSSTYAIRDYPQPIQERILNRASAYMASGVMGQAKAAEKSMRDFEDEVIKLDDFGSRPSFITVPNKQMDKEVLRSSISSFVQRQVELHGAMQDMPINIDDVNIFDHGNGRYSLQTNDGEPVRAFITHRSGAQKQGVMFFTLDDVQRQVEADAVEAAGELKADAVKRDEWRGSIDKPVVPGGKSLIGTIFSKIDGQADPKQGPQAADTAYGARTGNDLRKLDNSRLKEVYDASRSGKLKTSGFVTDKAVKDIWNSRVFQTAKKAGYTMEQVKAAMSRWNLDNELDAIERLKANKAPTK